ncbi:MAG: D-amino acid aminotransferase, partial [Gammaproteobacteria bacterium]|nr:D-amino acid aminotransferase [Gammaproteobacteria bacterium]
LLQADEIWLTSSTREISPVIQLDNTAIGDGKPGPLWNKMIVLYRDYTDAVRRGEAE